MLNEETDDVGMMARRPIRRTPTSSSSTASTTTQTSRSRSREPSNGESSWTRTVVFALDGTAASCLLPAEWNQEFYRRIARAINQEEIEETFLVQDRPDDLVTVDLQCLLVLRQGERRPITFLRLTLLDLEIFEANEILPGAFRRLAKWLPHVTTVISLFRVLSIEDLYQRHAHKTRLWVNNINIDLTQIEPIALEDGDYIKVFIGDDDQLALCESHSDATNLLQTRKRLSGPHMAKIGDNHLAELSRLDVCDRTVRPRRRWTRAPAEVDPDLRPLQELWNRPHLRARGLQNEPVMHFDTWFLSALDFPRRSTARMAALPENVQQWEAALRQVWRDRQHPHWPIRIVRIHPAPVGTANGGHLLILQHEHPGEAGILLTIHGGPAPDQFVQLVPGILPFDRLLWFADHEVRCTERLWKCHATHNQQLISSEEPWRTENGQHIELHVKRRADEIRPLMRTGPVPQQPDLPSSSQPTQSLDDFVFDPRAPEFVPHEPRLEAMPEVIQDLHGEWARATFSWEGEETTAEFTTWFVDQHDPALRFCWQPRNIQLTSQFAQWEYQIRRLWQDRIIDGVPSELVIVQPRPPQRGGPVAAHVLIVQRPQPELVTSIITVFDRAVPQPGPLWQLALTTHEHIFLEQIVHSLGLTQRCLLAGADRHCAGWYGNYQLIYGQALQGRDGYSIVLFMTARFAPATTSHSDNLPVLQAEDNDLSQGDMTVPSTNLLKLEDYLPLTEAVKVKAANPIQALPHYIEIPEGSAEQGVAEELKRWGFTSPVFEFGSRGDYLYFNIDQASAESGIHYMLCHDDIHDVHGSFLHTDDHVLTEQEIMRILYSLGYERAAVLCHEELLVNLRRIRFWNCQPTSLQHDKELRNRTPWPLRTCSTWEPRSLFPIEFWENDNQSPSCIVKTPLQERRHC